VQRNLFADLIYSPVVCCLSVNEIATLSFRSFYQEKEQSQPAAIERADVVTMHTAPSYAKPARSPHPAMGIKKTHHYPTFLKLDTMRY
jgi:hypothetical protein